MVYTGRYQCSPPEQLKQNTNQKTVMIQKKSFYCWVYSSKKIQLCSFQISWRIPFVLQHSNSIYWMLSVQPHEQLRQNTNKETAPIQKKSLYCWVYSSKKIQLCHFNFPGKFLLSYSTVMAYTGCYQCKPPPPPLNSWNKTQIKKLLWFNRKAFTAEFIPVKRFNFAYFNFPGNFLLSYKTVITYTGCYHCSPPEQLKQNTNQKAATIQKNSFHCWVYSNKKIQLCSFQLSWKIPFLLKHSNGIYWMLSVQPSWTAKTKHKSENCSDSKKKLLLLSLFL